MPGPLNDQWVFFPFAGITFGASAVNWLHWNDQKDCSQFYTQLYWQFVTPVSCGQKKKKKRVDFPRREAENRQEGGCLRIFTIATGKTGKNKSSFFVEQEGEFWCYVRKKK